MTSDPSEKPSGGRSRLPVGAIFALVLAVLAVLGAILFGAASCGAGPTGSTTGAGVILALAAAR